MKNQDKKNHIAIVHNPELDIYEEVKWQTNNFLAERFFNKLKAEIDWFEKVITHPVAIGTFYENLLRSTLREFAPSNNSISTGFVYDAQKNEHGKQIDVLIYNATDRNVLYKNDEFVVVYPGSVISVTEVKKTITTKNISEVIESTFFNSLGSRGKSVYGVQRLRVFGFKLGATIESIFDSILKSIENCINKTITENGKMLYENITLPALYFLQEPFYIETELLYVSKIEYKVVVSLHKADRHGSLGIYLSEVLEQNPTKINHDESDYLFQKMRMMPEKVSQTSETILLYRKLPFSDVVRHFRLDRMEIANYCIGKAKPLKFFIPITSNIDKFPSMKDLLSFDGNLVVLTEPEKENTLVKTSQLLNNCA